MVIAKIVSGGQTGVDRGAIEAAFDLGFPYGGLVPKGRLAEDGVVPAKFTEMEEASETDYLFRTEHNVVHSDATLVLAPECFEKSDDEPLVSGGTKKTVDFANRHGKPCATESRENPINKSYGLLCWLKSVKEEVCGGRPVVLNVAGPRESKCPGIAKYAYERIARLLKADRETDEATLDWERFAK